MGRNDDPQAGRTIAWGIVGAIFVFVMIVALQAFFYKAQDDEMRAKNYPVADENLNRLLAEQRQELNSYGWIDPQEGIVRIPIERAMELVIQEANQQTNSSEEPKE